MRSSHPKHPLDRSRTLSHTATAVSFCETNPAPPVTPNSLSATLVGMNRRDFARLSAMALAANRLSAQQSSAKPVGFAAVGLGTISGIFSEALAASQTAKLAAVVTGHPDTKGRDYTQKYSLAPGSVYTYETFDRIRDNKAVEAVYIGLPNAMHAEYTIRAAEAGKHVLCEKPMAISSAECRRMIEACRKNHVQLMIAYRLHYDPIYVKIREMIQQGAIGTLKSMQGSFMANFPAGAWRLNRALGGGGCLMDLGIYPLNGMRFFAGADPSAFTAQVATMDHSGKFQGIEESTHWTMTFPSGILASGSSSYGANGPNFLNLGGDKGSISISPAYAYDGLRVTGRTTSGPLNLVDDRKQPYQFQLEAEDFADAIRFNRPNRTPGEEGLADMLAIEAIYKTAGTPIA